MYILTLQHEVALHTAPSHSFAKYSYYTLVTFVEHALMQFPTKKKVIVLLQGKHTDLFFIGRHQNEC